MTTPKPRTSLARGQFGYLLEIPLLLMAVLIAVLILFPRLSLLGQKIMITIAAVPILFALYYMIVIPGWMPSDQTRLRSPWNWLVFLMVAAGVIGVVILVLMK